MSCLPPRGRNPLQRASSAFDTVDVQNVRASLDYSHPPFLSVQSSVLPLHDPLPLSFISSSSLPHIPPSRLPSLSLFTMHAVAFLAAAVSPHLSCIPTISFLTRLSLRSNNSSPLPRPSSPQTGSPSRSVPTPPPTRAKSSSPRRFVQKSATSSSSTVRVPRFVSTSSSPLPRVSPLPIDIRGVFTNLHHPSRSSPRSQNTRPSRARQGMLR